MKNPNSPTNKLKAFLSARWQAPDYPAGDARFQSRLFARDMATYVLLPMMAIFLSRSFSVAASPGRKLPARPSAILGSTLEPSKSQVIDFRGRQGSALSGVAILKRAPGTLVRVRLLNVVESYSATPIHAQIVDAGLGRSFIGGVLIGDGTSDASFDRINVVFRIARDPDQMGIAFPIAARGLSMNGTLGIEALKKEGAFARAAYGGASNGANEVQGNIESMDLRSIVVKALTAGLAQEFGAGAQVERNRAQVLTLKAGTEFFAELTDYFPAAGK